MAKSSLGPFLLGAAVVAAGGWMYVQSKKAALSKKFELKPATPPEVEPGEPEPQYVPPDCTSLTIYTSTIEFLRNWAFPLPGDKEEFRARVLEAIWAQYPACRGQFPQNITVEIEGEPSVTSSFEEAVDFAWQRFTGSG